MCTELLWRLAKNEDLLFALHTNRESSEVGIDY